MKKEVAGILAIAVYLAKDLLYIWLAKPVYADGVLRVQHSPLKLHAGFAVAAYTAMMLGWWVLVGSRVTAETPLLHAAGLGAVFGLCVYGTFNFTVGAMFREYRDRVVVQDMLWGVTAATVVTLFFRFLLGRAVPAPHPSL